MKTINLIINNLNLKANEGDTVLGVALANNIYIPTLCHCEDLKPVGVCRICLVEVEGRGIVTSCNLPVAEGMIVRTDTPEIEQTRRTIVELLLINHEGNCLECTQSGNCELQKVAKYVGIDSEKLQRYIRPQKKLAIDDSNPFFTFDPNKCIHCGICVRTCDELQNLQVINFTRRGFDTIVSTFNDRPLVDSQCKSCGECAVRCPTRAMELKTFRQPSYEVKSVCCYCGCGCGIYLGVRGNRVVSVRGQQDNPANSGSLCVKGRFGFEFINSKERLTTPLIKRSGRFVEATWEDAINLIVSKLSTCYGDKFALLASARTTNEDNYVMQKFARVVMGTNNVDHCARLCHAPTVAGLKQSFGSGAMTNSTQEIGAAKCIFAIGTNTTSAHPIIALQVKKAARNGATLIVANPRRIDLCDHATIFLQHRPGTDVALMMGIMRVIVDEKLEDSAFIAERCENYTEFKASLLKFDLDHVEQITGVAKEKVIAAARAFATNKPGSILYAMGITQHSHGTDNVLATSNLALLTGNVGKPSTGVNPLRGQNNVQGACDMGALPNVFSGYQSVTDAKVQQKFEHAWGVKLPKQPGLTHLEMVDAIDQGHIKSMYIVGENPVISEANAKHLASALKELEFLVVQDIFLTETAQLAHVVLPAVTFAEKDGTFTNTERRVQRVRKAITPLGKAKLDWQIICEIAQKMDGSGFDFTNSEQIMQEISALTPSYHGISYQRLEHGGLQWPCPSEEHPGTPYLHQTTFATANGKGRFVGLEFKPPAELPDNEYPFILTTDRSLFHYHTATMTRKVDGLNVLHPHETVRINPLDAEKLEIKNGDRVRVISRRGDVEAVAELTPRSSQGVVAMTFHFAESLTNAVTSAALDPVSKIPETKVCAVKVIKVTSSGHL